ncbi:ATP-binding protein [Intestinimonas butyriciproducens]|uniref:sensor histidine kinase n=1 Tax=Intestinimonas butyriciproducens TaxID=1297617 RepID=UPI0030B8969F
MSPGPGGQQHQIYPRRRPNHPPGGGGRGLARLSVQDEGQGIDAESLPHIFDRFFRTDQSRARQTGGTGLGLAIAKWIVERHGGWFEVLSREGIGTRMTMVLPLARLGED